MPRIKLAFVAALAALALGACIGGGGGSTPTAGGGGMMPPTPTPTPPPGGGMVPSAGLTFPIPETQTNVRGFPGFSGVEVRGCCYPYRSITIADQEARSDLGPDYPFYSLPSQYDPDQGERDREHNGDIGFPLPRGPIGRIGDLRMFREAASITLII